MKAMLELRAPSEVWLIVENDTDSDTQLQAVKIIVRWQDLERSGAWKPCVMFLGPRMTFRLEVTNLLRKAVVNELQAGFPPQPRDGDDDDSEPEPDEYIVVKAYAARAGA